MLELGGEDGTESGEEKKTVSKLMKHWKNVRKLSLDCSLEK